MNLPLIIAVTWIGKEYRFFGLDWSYLVVWYWSIGGSVVMCLYFVFKRNLVGMLAYLPNSMIYPQFDVEKSNSLAKELTRLAERPR